MATAAETGKHGMPKDAVQSGEGTVPLNFTDLMEGNFALGALHPATLAGLKSFSQPLNDKIPVQIIRRADPKAPGGYRQVAYDGLHRIAELLKKKQNEPGFIPTGVDITDDLKAAGIFPEGKHFTTHQAFELVRPQTQRQAEIDPSRFAGHLLTEWAYLVPEGISEKYPALAAIMLLVNTDELRNKPESSTKSYLGIVRKGKREVFEDREGFHMFFGETDTEKSELAFGLNIMANRMRSTNRRYDAIFFSALTAINDLTLPEDSEEQKRRQLTGLVAIPAVHEKIIRDEQNEAVIAQRNVQLADLLYQALTQATTHQVESREFRRALTDPHLSYDHLVYILTPPDSNDGSLISERYEEVKSEINEAMAIGRLAVNRKTRIPDPLKVAMRALFPRGEIFDVTGIAEIATAITSTEATVTSAIDIRARLAVLADGEPPGSTISAILKELDATLARLPNVRTPRGLDSIGIKLAGLVSRSKFLLPAEDTADSGSRVVYVAADRSGGAVTAVASAKGGQARAADLTAEAATNGNGAVATPAPEVRVHVTKGASAAEMEANPVETILRFGESLDGLELTAEVRAALITTRTKIDDLLSRVNWTNIAPDVQNVGSVTWFGKKYWPGEDGKRNETPKDLDRHQATLLFSHIARRELSLKKQEEEVVMKYVRDSSGNTGLDALDNSFTNRLALMAKQLSWDSSTPELKYLVMSHYSSTIRPRYEELSTRPEISEPEEAELTPLQTLIPRIDDRLDTYAEEHFENYFDTSTIRYLDLLRYTVYTNPALPAYKHGIELIRQKEKDSVKQKDIISKLQRASGVTSIEGLFDKTVLGTAA